MLTRDWDYSRGPAMNGRATDQDTSPEARIAAVARALQLKFDPDSKVPDFADYRDAIRVFVRKELILARIDEARKCGGLMVQGRVAELGITLAECEKEIPHDAYFPSDPRSHRSEGDKITERNLIAAQAQRTTSESANAI
jgi:hypothetical protein